MRAACPGSGRPAVSNLSAIERCLVEQIRCANYLLHDRGDECRGAALGLADWVAEEVLIRLEDRK